MKTYFGGLLQHLIENPPYALCGQDAQQAIERMYDVSLLEWFATRDDKCDSCIRALHNSANDEIISLIRIHLSGSKVGAPPFNDPAKHNNQNTETEKETT